MDLTQLDDRVVLLNSNIALSGHVNYVSSLVK